MAEKPEEEEPDADQSVITKISASRGPCNSAKADSRGGCADKRVASRDVDTGQVNNAREA